MEGVVARRAGAAGAARALEVNAVIVTVHGPSTAVAALLASTGLAGKTQVVLGVPSLRTEIEEGTHAVQRRRRPTVTYDARRRACWTRRP